MRKQSFWLTVLLVLVIAVWVVNTGPKDAIDEEHARNAALFRLAVNLVVIIGLPFCWWMIWKTRAAASPITSAPIENLERAIAVLSYESEPDAFWRCNLNLMKKPGNRRRFITLPLLLTITVSAYLAARFTLQLAALLFVPLFAVTAVVWGALVLLLVRKEISSMFPEGLTRRLWSTVLTEEGVVDGPPEKRSLLPWTEITAMESENGDLFFQAGTRSRFIPREAFPSEKEARQYLESARRLWCAAKRRERAYA